MISINWRCDIEFKQFVEHFASGKFLKMALTL